MRDLVTKEGKRIRNDGDVDAAFAAIAGAFMYFATLTEIPITQVEFAYCGIAGADPESGTIAVGGELEVGQTVQFHVRDARSADEDLRRALEREAAALAGRPAAGALLFTCTGRGPHMFAEPDHDTGLLAQTLGQIPVAGFFCGGELGPVGGQNFLHTFTASIALFPETGLPEPGVSAGPS